MKSDSKTKKFKPNLAKENIILHSISIIIPIFNEKDNIVDLLEEIYFFLSSFINFEIIVVNDASTDFSYEILKTKKESLLFTVISHKKRMGQSKAILSGIKESKYDSIVTIDGDGQNNPKDILKLIELYFNKEHFDLIGGLRKKRKDNYIKILSSIIANKVRMQILGDKCSDTGCSLKIFNKKIFLSFPFFEGIHRFLPSLFEGVGYKTKYVEVDHRLRIRGKSKYGTWKRLYKGIIDIYKVKTIINKLK